MDISSLLNNAGGASSSTRPPHQPPPPPAPPSARASAADRMGKDRVLRPCAGCNFKNHIRSTHCSQCRALLRPPTSAGYKSHHNPKSSSSSSPAPSHSGAGSGQSGPVGSHVPPPPAGGMPSSVSDNRHGHGQLPSGRSQQPSSSSSRGFSSSSHHNSSRGLPAIAGPPPPVPKMPQNQHPPKKRRTQNLPQSSNSGSTSNGAGSSSGGSGSGDEALNPSALVRAQRVMRSCTSCGVKNHIRSGTCKACGHHIENLGRQRFRGSSSSRR